VAKRPGEFELIAELFAPLAAGYPGALDLKDDAAIVETPPGQCLIVTMDTIVAGVHFLPDDPAESVARKLLRVNLSDLAAKGARPTLYVLAISMPDSTDIGWLRDFAFGLALDQREFDIALAGGDTTSTPGPLTLTVTALGEMAQGTEIRRSGAQTGDRVFVSGTLGDAALGLKSLRGELANLAPEHRSALVARYRVPHPRVSLGQSLVGLATACCDVSDGLVADLGHICETSRVAAQISVDRIPLSPATRAALAIDPDLVKLVATGGDDYELVFTAPESRGAEVVGRARDLGVVVTEIGQCVSGAGVTLLDPQGQPLTLSAAGWRHF
jgi:thiamine-monophosphate kinase